MPSLTSRLSTRWAATRCEFSTLPRGCRLYLEKGDTGATSTSSAKHVQTGASSTELCLSFSPSYQPFARKSPTCMRGVMAASRKSATSCRCMQSLCVSLCFCCAFSLSLLTFSFQHELQLEMDVNFYAPRHGHSVCDGHFGALKKVCATVPAFHCRKIAHTSNNLQTKKSSADSLQVCKRRCQNSRPNRGRRTQVRSRPCSSLFFSQLFHRCRNTWVVKLDERKKSHPSTISASQGWMGSPGTFPSSSTLPATR